MVRELDGPVFKTPRAGRINPLKVKKYIRPRGVNLTWRKTYSREKFGGPGLGTMQLLPAGGPRNKPKL